MASRIGNTSAIKVWQVKEGIFFKNDSKLVRVTSVHGNDICIVRKENDAVVEEKTVCLKELEPVLITAKFLEWLGFVPQENCWRLNLYLYRPEDGTVFRLYQDQITVHYTERINVWFVHDLQNVITK